MDMVTPIQRKDKLISIPSEEWRSAYSRQPVMLKNGLTAGFSSRYFSFSALRS